MEKSLAPAAAKVVEALGPTLIRRDLAGVPVIDVRGKTWTDDGTTIVYLHGGAFVFFSAESTLDAAALVADATGRRVVSVDYTLAPRAKWREISDQVTGVVRALLAEGVDPSRLILFGESAGGALALATAMRLRDEGPGQPAAIVIWSPWTDLADVGDSRITLRCAEPFYRYDPHMRPAALAYALEEEWRNPLVSPVHGDFARGFPPTLIQVGTREILLSDSVRLYQRLVGAGNVAVLDVYEGMPHVFPVIGPELPETTAALSRLTTFLDTHVPGAPRAK